MCCAGGSFFGLAFLSNDLAQRKWVRRVISLYFILCAAMAKIVTSSDALGISVGLIVQLLFGCCSLRDL